MLNHDTSIAGMDKDEPVAGLPFQAISGHSEVLGVQVVRTESCSRVKLGCHFILITEMRTRPAK